MISMLGSRNVRALILCLCCFAFADELRATDDWPMWRANAHRSAATSNPLPRLLERVWSQRFEPRKQAWDDPLNHDLMTYDRLFEPIVYGDRLIVGFNDQDKVEALDVSTGQHRWTFYCDAPVRLPPVGWNGAIYFCSDDGFLYCVEAESGQLKWKFSGAPSSQKALGNQRITSAWPARGGPVIYDGSVYFAASIWPFMGTFVYALDAQTGEVRWVNDRTGAQYIKQPHSAPSFAGVAPQGAMVATQDLLIVPGGRSVPAVFDRHTGELKYFEINAGGKGTGGSFVTADEFFFYVHTREKGTRAFDLKTGVKTAFTPNEPVLHQGMLYAASEIPGADGTPLIPVIQAFRVADDSKVNREPVWQVTADGTGDLILAGSKLVAAGGGQLTVIDLADDSPSVERQFVIGDDVARVLVASNRLFTVGMNGAITAYGDPSELRSDAQEAVVAETIGKRHAGPELFESGQAGRQLLAQGDAQGYAFWFGSTAAAGLSELVAMNPFSQLAVVDSDVQSIARLRAQLDQAGRYGRVTVHVGNPLDFRAPQLVAHMIFVNRACSDDEWSAIYGSVRPYGGAMVVLTEDPDKIQRQLADLELEQAEFSRFDGGLVVRRQGALPGSADWTHQYGDVANTIKSDDARVKLPLGILWFGGSSNMDVLPRHGHGPPEQVVGGRLFIQGMNCLSARDVYTGRVLWKHEFEDLGTYDVYYDATYENTPLNPKYNQVHIPGANGRGTNYVATEDAIYIIVGADCQVLDPATGNEVNRIRLPENDDGTKPEWGYIGVYDDVLLGGLGFANYRDRYALEFPDDGGLKSSRAGFGSKSFDRAASRGLVAFDRHSGRQLWRADANHSFWHNGIVAGGDRIYCLDRNPSQVEAAMRRRGLAMPDTYRIVCYDANTGQPLWEVNEGIFGSWLGYSEELDLLLQAGAQASDRLYAEVGQGMRVYHATDGQLKWKNDALKYAGPCILHNDLIMTNANSYTESAGAFSLETGEQKMVKHPLTGELQPWKISRAYGCNNIIASENLLTFRSGAAGYYDLLSNSGTGNLGGFKSGCTSNLVVANGVLNAPDYTRTCSCSYQNQTSLALVHMPDVEMWSVNAMAAAESNLGRIKNAGINFGAPGDRRDAEGTLWLEYPIVAGDSPELKVTLNPEAQLIQQHSSRFVDSQTPWIYASGYRNVRSVRLDLSIAEALDLSAGIPVVHANDDAEEDENGEVSLGSSDLELTSDGQEQTIGLRFASVPLQRGARIKEAYIQFACDEPSDEETQLMISGQLAGSAEQFVEQSHDVSSRDRTASQVAWSPPAWERSGESGDAQRTPNLAEIIQEIVDLPTWQIDNAMALLIEGSGKRVAAASRGRSSEGARLIVIADESAQTDARPAKPAQYFDVTLLFAEDPTAMDQSQTQFDVAIQGSQVAEDLSLPHEDSSGAATRQLVVENVAVRDGLSIEVNCERGGLLLCGLRVEKRD